MAATDHADKDRTSNAKLIFENAFAVTPHDTNELAHVSDAIWVGGAGNIVLVTVNGDTATLSGIPAGTLIPLRVKVVKATLTTATLIVALY